MKYQVYGTAVGSCYLGEVEADSLEEAFVKAWRQAGISLCHECSAKMSDPEVEKITLVDADDTEYTEEL